MQPPSWRPEFAQRHGVRSREHGRADGCADGCVRIVDSAQPDIGILDHCIQQAVDIDLVATYQEYERRIRSFRETGDHGDSPAVGNRERCSVGVRPPEAQARRGK